MADYTLMAPEMQAVKRNVDGAIIPFDPTNPDFQEYQAWLAVPNVPDPYVAPPPAPPQPTTVVLFDHENRIRAQEGQPPLTLQQFTTANGL